MYKLNNQYGWDLLIACPYSPMLLKTRVKSHLFEYFFSILLYAHQAQNVKSTLYIILFSASPLAPMEAIVNIKSNPSDGFLINLMAFGCHTGGTFCFVFFLFCAKFHSFHIKLIKCLATHFVH